MNTVKIAVIQIRTELEQDVTLEKAGRMVHEAAENGAQIAVLPEMFNCPYSRHYFRPIAHLGHEKIARHRKVHLFDVDIPGMRFSESATFTPGNEITVFDTKYGKMGVAVCFDVRFPELFRAMAVRGAQVAFLPAQFNTATGPTHWEMTLRSRAVDNEFFVVGASAALYEGFDYECWGHSAVCDPFGTVIDSCDEREQILYSTIDLDRVDEVRRRLPTFLHLRRDVYTVTE